MIHVTNDSRSRRSYVKSSAKSRRHFLGQFLTYRATLRLLGRCQGRVKSKSSEVLTTWDPLSLLHHRLHSGRCVLAAHLHFSYCPACTDPTVLISSTHLAQLPFLRTTICRHPIQPVLSKLVPHNNNIHKLCTQRMSAAMQLSVLTSAFLALVTSSSYAFASESNLSLFGAPRHNLDGVLPVLAIEEQFIRSQTDGSVKAFGGTDLQCSASTPCPDGSCCNSQGM